MEDKTTIESIGVWWYMCICHEIYAKTNDTFGSLKFWMLQNLHAVLSQTYDASRESNIEFHVNAYFRLNSEFYTEIIKVFLWNA